MIRGALGYRWACACSFSSQMTVPLMKIPTRCLCLLTLSAPCVSLAAGQDFGDEQVLTTNATRARSVVAADLDGDGDLDALSTGKEANVEWFENKGGGVFGQPQIIPSTCGPRMASAADLDNDGDLDVLIAFGNCAQIGWTEN